jgi:hypothetical protein
LLDLLKLLFQFSSESQTAAMELFLKTFIFTLFLEMSNSLTLQCEYKFLAFTWEIFLIQDYGCKATIVPGSEESYITDVSKNHISEKTFDDVRLLLYAHNQTVSTLPKFGLKYYPNLQAYSASNVGLEKVTSRDFLNVSPKLKIIFLYNNKIQEIPSDLFTLTPNIEYLALNGNQIKHVGLNFINSLNLATIKKLGIFGNSCTNFEIVGADNKKKIDELKLELKEKCHPTQEMIELEEASKTFSEKEIQDELRKSMPWKHNEF